MKLAERNERTKAVKIIESAYLLCTNKKKLKELRNYLWSIPFECRMLYLRVRQVREEADVLKADLDKMVYRKKENMFHVD